MIKIFHYLLVTGGLLAALSACAPDPAPTFKAWSTEERAETQIKLGFSYLQRDQLDVARESFNTAIEVDPKSSEAYHGLGLVEAKSLNLKQALNYLKQSVDLDRKNIAAVSDYAVMLCQDGAARTGVNVLESNVKEFNRLSTQLAFARCYEADNQIDNAIVFYKKVLELNPNSTQALLSLGRLYYDRKSYLSASAFLQRYFYTNTISSDALLLAANVEQMLDNPEERDYYTQLLWSRYPRSKEAIEARELYSQ